MATRKKAPSRTGSTRKAAPKRTTPKASSARVTTPERVTESNETTTTDRSSSLRIKRSYVITVLAIVLIAGLLYLFRSWFVVAMVNGEPISRISYVNEMERQAGKQTMNALVTKTLIYQEARKEHVTVSDDEVNKELKTIEDNLKKQGQRLDQVLTLQGMTKDQLVDQIRIQKLIEKMVGKNVKVSNKEVDDYIAANKDSLPQNADENSLRKTATDRLKQQKLNEEVQKWLENLQKNAKINYFVNI